LRKKIVNLFPSPEITASTPLAA
jgi:hypothetical protein